jgi:VIT1/CCC1 family predicted Fe2+/Mn2+ transporter
VTPLSDKQQRLSELHAALGYKPLSRTWAKAEILLGLLATGIGALVGAWAVARLAEVEWPFVAGGLALFVLGAYLALAGHRSHLYQSNNELTALLLEHVQRLEGKG